MDCIRTRRSSRSLLDFSSSLSIFSAVVSVYDLLAGCVIERNGSLFCVLCVLCGGSVSWLVISFMEPFSPFTVPNAKVIGTGNENGTPMDDNLKEETYTMTATVGVETGDLKHRCGSMFKLVVERAVTMLLPDEE